MTTKRRLSFHDIPFMHKQPNESESIQGQKRPRTEEYLKQKAVYEDVLHSCTRLSMELSKLTSCDDQEDSCRQIRARPSRRIVLKSTEQTIRRHMEGYKQKFLGTCHDLQSEAKEAIDLSRGFDSLSRAIDSSEQDCLLSVLNVGHETTSAIKLRIAEYAGVASADHLDDVRSLSALIQMQNNGR